MNEREPLSAGAITDPAVSREVTKMEHQGSFGILWMPGRPSMRPERKRSDGSYEAKHTGE